jgi:ankyrin repeat protein
LLQVNLQDKQGRTPLHIASFNTSFEIAKILLEKGRANVQLRNLGGLTALHLASAKGSSEIVQLLVDHNIEIDAAISGKYR